MQLLDTAAFNISTPFGRLYSAWYDHYMAPGVFKVLETDLHGRFMERVGSGSRVLDVGCGGGQHAVHMASRRPDLRVVGVDLSPELVRRSRRLAAKAGVADRVEFVEGNALDLPFPNQDFDHLYCAGSIKALAGSAAGTRRMPSGAAAWRSRPGNGSRPIVQVRGCAELGP